MKTVFYAWQKDRPPNTNKSFLEECLKRAIKKANESRPTSEQLVLDKDTQGISGMPDIAKEIFDKISGCAVFVPDLSFVTPDKAPRPICNPNVLIELGYAFKAIGDRRLVALFNTAFGPTSELPFDLRSRRFPLDYHLTEDASTETRQSVRDNLVKRLAGALTIAADHAPVEPEPPGVKAPAHAAAPLNDCTFMSPSSPVIAEAPAQADDGTASEHVYWYHGPCAWLRILPSKPLQLAWAQLRTTIEQTSIPLEPFGNSPGRHHCLNSHGAVVLAFEGTIAAADATQLTQVFRSGEIWGLNKQLLQPPKATPRERLIIPWPDVSTAFERTLQNYLHFAKEAMHVEPPLTIVAGLAMVNEAMFVRPSQHGFAAPDRHRCLEPFIRQRWDVDTFDIDPRKLFADWYVALWDACGGLVYSHEEAHVHKWPR